MKENGVIWLQNNAEFGSEGVDGEAMVKIKRSNLHHGQRSKSVFHTFNQFLLLFYYFFESWVVNKSFNLFNLFY